MTNLPNKAKFSAVPSLVGNLGVRQLGLDGVDRVGDVVNNELEGGFARSEVVGRGHFHGVLVAIEVVHNVVSNIRLGGGISHEGKESRAEVGNVVRHEPFRERRE